jgi:hypothetical protein
MAEPEETTTTTGTENTGEGTATETGAAATTTQSTELDWQSEAEKWKALSRKNEAQAKANADAAKQWSEFQESQKSETDKLKEHAAELETQLKQAQTTALRSQYAAKNQIPMELLTADTEDALDAQVKALLAFKTPQAAGRSNVDTQGGSQQATIFTQAQISDPKFYQTHRSEILKAMAEGRIK